MLFGSKERLVVRTLGDEVLREHAEPVPAVTPEIRDLAAYMLRAMRARLVITSGRTAMSRRTMTASRTTTATTMEAMRMKPGCFFFRKRSWSFVSPRSTDRAKGRMT